MNHPFGIGRCVGFGLAALLSVAGSASAQVHELESFELKVPQDTGWVENTHEGGGPVVVASFPVYAAGAQWMRLFFDDVRLSGTPELGNGSFLRITSMLDGYEQRLNAAHVRQWQESSAYFNGDALLVEILAYPGTGPSRLVLDKTIVGLPPIKLESQCGANDDRMASNDPRAARLLPIGCTGWIINDACGCFLTAGHCSSGSNVAQFNVPLSNANGSLNNPSPDDQYALDPASRQSNGGQGIGNDYAYMGFFANSNTGLTPRQAQGAAYVIVNPPAYQNGQVIRVTGFGTDTGTANQTQQTHSGPRVDTPLSTELEYQVDTTGGNSGSPVIFESTGQAVGIHTHAGCSSTAGNHGTGLNHPGLQAFLASPKGICFKAGCAVTATTQTFNGSGANPVCLASQNGPVIGQTWLVDVDATGVPGATATFVQGRRNGTSGTFLSIGEVLIDLSSALVFVNQVNGSGNNTHAISVPNLAEIVGLTLHIQGGVLGASGITQLCNGEVATVGCQ